MNYSFSDKVLIRTPLNPFQEKFSIYDLKELFTSKESQEALFLSSPLLLEECKKWLNNEISDRKKETRIIFSLLKYAKRMHTRCTPFGLFAGCSLQEWQEEYEFHKKYLSRNTRLDMNYSCLIAQELSKVNSIRKYLIFYPNTSIHYIQGKIRYTEYYLKNNKRNYQISSVEASDFLVTILKKAQEGATISDLIKALVNNDTTDKEASEFIHELIDSQLLVSELEPSASGYEVVDRLIKVLSRICDNNQFNDINRILTLLKNVKDDIEKLDKKIGNEICLYYSIVDKLNKLNIPFDLGKLFQTDLFNHLQLPYSAKENLTAKQKTQSALTKAIKVLNKLTPKNSNTNLKTFIENFITRYEHQKIPLLEALDNELGLGYGSNKNNTGDYSPLLNDITIPPSIRKKEIALNYNHSFLLKKALQAKEDNLYVIKIEENELNDYDENWTDLPVTMTIMYSHLGERNSIPLLSLKHVGCASATTLMGRFASGSESIFHLIKDIVHSENNHYNDAILAEINHLPENGMGNFLLRPIFREFEIPYLANSDLSIGQRIDLSDLIIYVRNNKIFLFSKKLQKQIIPRLGNAHNYSFKTLPIYHFLCDLQTQDIRSSLYLDWGFLKEELTFFPRIEVENVIISYATWHLKKNDFEEIINNNSVDIHEVIELWRCKYKIPELALFVESDNELLINFTDTFSINMFVHIIKTRTSIMLKEFIFYKNGALIKNSSGKAYTNEILSFLIKEELPIPSNTVNQIAIGSQKSIKRNFSIGSEWLYYKIYCGLKTSDEVLQSVYPLTEKLLNKKIIDQWFFIRYTDPDAHIRIRFHVPVVENLTIIMDCIHQQIREFVASGRIWKIQIDSYQRELERYGHNTIELAEKVFFYDSLAVVKMIASNENDINRWFFAIKSINDLLDNFKFSNKERVMFFNDLKNNFAIEFGLNKYTKTQIDKKFRENRKALNKAINNQNTDHLSMELIKTLIERTENIRPIANELLHLSSNNQLEVSKESLLASYIHMNINRIFRSKQRLHELVLYDFMWRLYKSEDAKSLNNV